MKTAEQIKNEALQGLRAEVWCKDCGWQGLFAKLALTVGKTKDGIGYHNGNCPECHSERLGTLFYNTPPPEGEEKEGE